MKRTKHVRGSATQSAKCQLEMDLQLLKQRTELERQAESRRQDHEWKMMFAEKGVFAIVVVFIAAVVTFCGNVFVERYKSDTSSQQARAQTVRASCNEVWGKLASFEESVGQYDEVIRTLHFNKDFGVFRTRKERASDQASINRISTDTKHALSNLWKTLRAQELNLGPNMHAVFFRAMQDIAELRIIYETAALHEGKLDKIDYDAIDEVRNDLKEQKKLLSSVVNQS
jgi:hypothetical protein